MRGFVRVFSIISLITLTACTVFKERPAKTFEQATGGEGLERVFWMNVKAKNWRAIDQAVASKFVATVPQGQMGRDAWLELLKQMDLKDVSIGDLQVELNGNTLVVAYQIALSGTGSGQPLASTPAHQMSVWHQQKSGWVLIAHASGN